MKLRYAAPALSHLQEIFAYTSANNPAAARRVIGDIRFAADRLKASPFVGRPGTASGTREWVVRRRPYIIVYWIEPGGDVLTILAIYHAAQLRP